MFTGILGGSLTLGAVLITVAWRNHKHEKTARWSCVAILAGAMLATFGLSVAAAGLFHATESGIGLVIIAIILAGTGTDVWWQVARGHEFFHKVKTSWKAAALGATAMIVMFNIGVITHNVRTEVTGHNVTQVVSKVTSNGQ